MDKKIPGRSGHDFSLWNEFIFKICAFERTIIIHISKSNLANYFIQKLRGSNQKS